MLSTGQGIFIQLPDDSNRRILHPAKVVSVDGDLQTAELAEHDTPVEAGQEVLVYFDRNREFLQQPGRIDAVIQTEPTAIVGLAVTGEPVSAETRQCYRVSAVTSGLTVTVEGGETAAVADISASGFSMISGGSYKVGQVLSVCIRFENEEFPGKACIQGAKVRGDGRTRYGLHCVNDVKVGGDLERGLRHISMAVQRQQLARQSRSRAG